MCESTQSSNDIKMASMTTGSLLLSDLLRGMKSPLEFEEIPSCLVYRATAGMCTLNIFYIIEWITSSSRNQRENG